MDVVPAFVADAEATVLMQPSDRPLDDPALRAEPRAVRALRPGDPRLNATAAGFGADRLRTALTRACKAAGIPAFSPHDLRHRRATLWHLSGVPIVEAAAWLGHSPQEHLKTYAHATLADRTELEHAKLLRRVRTMLPPVLPPA